MSLWVRLGSAVGFSLPTAAPARPAANNHDEEPKMPFAVSTWCSLRSPCGEGERS
jgi:hypothetical protein